MVNISCKIKLVRKRRISYFKLFTFCLVEFGSYMFCSVLINVCVVTVQKMVMTTTTASTGVSDKDLQIELSTIFALRHMQDRLPPVVSLAAQT